MSGETEQQMSGLPIACNLTERELIKRRQEIASDIFKSFQQVNELPDGYAFCYPFSEAVLTKLVEFVAFERRCCPFITFELVFEPDQGPIWVRLRGAAGVKEFIRDELRMLGASDAP